MLQGYLKKSLLFEGIKLVLGRSLLLGTAALVDNWPYVGDGLCWETLLSQESKATSGLSPKTWAFLFELGLNGLDWQTLSNQHSNASGTWPSTRSPAQDEGRGARLWFLFFQLSMVVRRKPHLNVLVRENVQEWKHSACGPDTGSWDFIKT